MPPLNQCCHTNADCGGGAVCQRGACVPVPTFSIDVASGLSRGGTTPANLSAVSTDNSQVYLLDYGLVGGTTTPQIHAFSPTGTSLWVQPRTPSTCRAARAATMGSASSPSTAAGSVTRVDTSANPNQQLFNNSGTGVLVDKAGNAIAINSPNTAGPVFVYSPAGTERVEAPPASISSS